MKAQSEATSAKERKDEPSLHSKPVLPLCSRSNPFLSFPRLCSITFSLYFSTAFIFPAPTTLSSGFFLQHNRYAIKKIISAQFPIIPTAFKDSPVQCQQFPLWFLNHRALQQFGGSPNKFTSHLCGESPLAGELVLHNKPTLPLHAL